LPADWKINDGLEGPVECEKVCFREYHGSPLADVERVVELPTTVASFVNDPDDGLRSRGDLGDSGDRGIEGIGPISGLSRLLGACSEDEGEAGRRQRETVTRLKSHAAA
jgi:hypothetical protein